MADSSTRVDLASTIGHPVTEKLTKANFALWKMQVLSTICGAQLMRYIDGTIVAPPHRIEEDKAGKKEMF